MLLNVLLCVHPVTVITKLGQAKGLMYDNPIFQAEMKVQDTSSSRSPQTTVVEQSWLYDKDNATDR